MIIVDILEKKKEKLAEKFFEKKDGYIYIYI